MNPQDLSDERLAAEISAEIDRLAAQLAELDLLGEDNRGTPRLPANRDQATRPLWRGAAARASHQRRRIATVSAASSSASGGRALDASRARRPLVRVAILVPQPLLGFAQGRLVVEAKQLTQALAFAAVCRPELGGSAATRSALDQVPTARHRGPFSILSLTASYAAVCALQAANS